jgi:hypothetical protein
MCKILEHQIPSEQATKISNIPDVQNTGMSNTNIKYTRCAKY